MGLFKQFIKESSDMKQRIYDILDEMSDNELDDFGYYLYSEFFDRESDEQDDDSFDIDDTKELLSELGSEFYETILDMLSTENIEDQHDTSDAEEYHDVDPEDQTAETNEAVGRRMLKKNVNRKKRKFMSNSKADMRKTKSARKKAARINRPKAKRNYRANKQKIKSYQASRAALIKSGKHIVKKRRSA